MSARDFLAELDDVTVPTITEPQKEEEEEAEILPSLKLFSKLERNVMDLLLEGLSSDMIALRLALPQSTVEAIVVRKDIQEHLKLLSESLNQIELMRLKSLYSKAIAEKITEAEETGKPISKKDIVDIMKAYQDLLVAEKKAAEPDKNQNIMIQILQQVMD